MASPALGGTPLTSPPPSLSAKPPAAASSSQPTVRAAAITGAGAGAGGLPMTLSTQPAEKKTLPPHHQASSQHAPNFTFPRSHSNPPMYTLQPNLTTREAQFQKWSHIILTYCAYHNLFVLSFPDVLDSPLFRNRTLRRSLRESNVRAVVTWMASDAGGRRAEWKAAATGERGGGGGGMGMGMGTGSGTGTSSLLWPPVLLAASKPGQERAFWVYWRRPDEWADAIYAWVEGTGQKGSVLTLWEILEGEGTVGEKFHGMDGELFDRVLKMLVRRGKAQMFGEEDSRGIKFF